MTLIKAEKRTFFSMIKKEFVIRLSESDRYRHIHSSQKGKIAYFSVQIETKVNNIWFPVVRYDTAHGFAHRDILNAKGEEIGKTPLFNQDFSSALTFAENDLKLNWEFYKTNFLKNIKNENK